MCDQRQIQACLTGRLCLALVPGALVSLLMYRVLAPTVMTLRNALALVQTCH